MAELRCNDGTVVQISAETEAGLRKAFEPKHVWEHGDVFRWVKPGGDGSVMIYLIIGVEPVVYTLVSEPKCRADYHPAVACPEPVMLLKNATFLFNIKDKL